MSTRNYASTPSNMSVSAANGVVIKVLLERGGKEPEVRRIRGCFRFEELVSVVRNMWNSAPKRLTLEYVDDEGDRVRIGSDLEWEEAVQQHANTAGALKLFARRGRYSKKADGRAEDDSSDNEEIPAGDDGRLAAVAPPAAAAGAAGASVPQPQVQMPHVPPLAVERAVPSVAPPSPTQSETNQPEPEAEPETEPATQSDTTAAVKTAEEADVTIDLLSRLYDCDAAKEMLDMFTRVDFSPVVTRRVDAAAQEIHVDVDKIALRHLTVTRTNLWIGSGLYEKAESTLEAALKVWPDDAVLEYNTACAASLRGEVHKSLGYLQQAVQHGYRNAEQVRRDPDLAHVRDHPDFGALLASMNGSLGASSRSATSSDPVRQTAAAAPMATAAPAASPAAEVRQETDVDRLLAVFPHLSVAEATGLMNRFGSLPVAVNFYLHSK